LLVARARCQGVGDAVGRSARGTMPACDGRDGRSVTTPGDWAAPRSGPFFPAFPGARRAEGARKARGRRAELAGPEPSAPRRGRPAPALAALGQGGFALCFWGCVGASPWARCLHWGRVSQDACWALCITHSAASASSAASNEANRAAATKSIENRVAPGAANTGSIASVIPSAIGSIAHCRTNCVAAASVAANNTPAGTAATRCIVSIEAAGATAVRSIVNSTAICAFTSSRQSNR
jgi:hypothetical protein